MEGFNQLMLIFNQTENRSFNLPFGLNIDDLMRQFQNLLINFEEKLLNGSESCGNIIWKRSL